MGHSSYETSSKSHAARLQDERFAHETSSKCHASSLKNELFVRDFLQKVTHDVSKMSVSCETSWKNHMSSPNTSVSCETSSKTHMAKSAKGTFHITPARPPANANVTATFTSTTTYNLPIPSPATNLSASTRLTRTKYCACHEMSSRHTWQPDDSLRLPTKLALSHLKSHTKYCACHEK